MDSEWHVSFEDRIGFVKRYSNVGYLVTILSSHLGACRTIAKVARFTFAEGWRFHQQTCNLSESTYST